MNDFLRQGFEEMQKESKKFDQEHAEVEQEIKDFKEGMKRGYPSPSSVGPEDNRGYWATRNMIKAMKYFNVFRGD